jgi:hypothetical protein
MITIVIVMKRNYYNKLPNSRRLGIMDDGNNTTFDPTTFNDVGAKLYQGSRSIELVATNILLMSLCTIHGVINKLCNGLFTLLHDNICY